MQSFPLLMALLLSLVAAAVVPPAFADLALPGAPAPAPFDEVAAPWDLPGEGARVVVHAAVSHPHGPTVIFALEDEHGALVMYAVRENGRIRFSDGYADDGVTPRPLVDGPVIGQIWYRVDVVLAGATYAAEVDGNPAAAARAFSPAGTARLADPASLPHGPGHDADAVRIAHARYLPAAAASTTFGAPLPAAGWDAHATAYGQATAEPAPPGHLSAGRFAARAQVAPLLPRGVHAPGPVVPAALAYAHHALPANDGAYLVEAWGRPHAVSLSEPDGVPDHQVVVAGVSGPLDDPAVRWAVAMAPLGVEHSVWGFHLLGPDGSRTPLSEWTPVEPYWHHVRVLVDEDAGTLHVQVDGDPRVKRFAFGDALAASERIAIGDVWSDHPHWTGAGRSYVDNVVIDSQPTTGVDA